MGFFDFSGKKKLVPKQITQVPEADFPEVAEASGFSDIPSAMATPAPDVSVLPTALDQAPISEEEIPSILEDACAHLERKDLPGAMQLYENLLARAGDTPDALTTISADLGANGYIDSLIELIAPVYDTEKHGPMPGINLLQAYLAVQNTGAAQQLLDVLRAMAPGDLETRLDGFAGVLDQQKRSHASVPRGASIGLISISKPIWFYGFESAPVLLPTKNSAAKRIAFAPLAVPREAPERGKEVELDPFIVACARAIPLFLADSFYFTENYNSLALVTITDKTDYFSGATEWLPDQIRGLSTAEGGGHVYAVTGVIQLDGDLVTVGVRIWETAKARARKLFSVNVRKADLGEALLKLAADLLYYMEAKNLPPAAGPFAVVPTSLSTDELLAYAQSLDLFVVQKEILPREKFTELPANLHLLSAGAVAHPTLRFAALALSGQLRGEKLGVGEHTALPVRESARKFEVLRELAS